MRVTLFCEASRNPSGIGRYVRGLAGHLCSLEPDGFEFDFRARFIHSDLSSDLAGVPVRLHALPGQVQAFVRRLPRGDTVLYGIHRGIAHEPSYVHIQRTRNLKVVYSIHDIGWRISDVPYGLSPSFIASAERCILQGDLLIVPSESVKADVLAYFPRRPEDVSVIPYGIDDAFLEPCRTTSLELPGRYWLYVGATNPRKNLARIVAAIALSRQRLPLVVAGPPSPNLAELETEASHRGVDLIRYESPSDAVVRELYARATGVLLVSLWEGFGYPIVEAAAQGTPVITSDRSAMSEIGDRYAWLVDPLDPESIAAALDAVVELDADQLDTLATEGRRIAQGYGWRQCLDRHLDVYRRLV